MRVLGVAYESCLRKVGMIDVSPKSVGGIPPQPDIRQK